MLPGGSYTSAQIVERLQTIVDRRNDVNAAKAVTKARLAAESADMPSARIFMDALVTFTKAAFGTAPDVLADFGLQTKERATTTVEAKAAAAAKRQATRAARHTMGSQQKKSVKGAVTGILVTPITAPQPVATASGSPSAPATSAGTTTAATPHTT